MSYTFPIDPQDLFSERTAQFVNLGLPREEIHRLTGVVVDMWADGPGGWTYEWSRLAARYVEAGEAQLASLAYGGARFPCLADHAKAVALQHQVEQYTLAAESFPVEFERRWVTTRLRGEIVEVPVHVLSEPGASDDTPVLIASGGIDTWKMDLHPMWLALVLGAGVRVVAFDHPGVGELTHIPMSPGTAEIVDGLISFARTLTRGKVGHFGLSFGGYFAARSGLRQLVDAAVVLGGPVSSASFGAENARKLLFGMNHIFGNAVGFSAIPTIEQIIEVSESFAMDDLLTKGTNSPTLVINGDADVHVPVADVTIFEGRPTTHVHLIPGGTHCAMNKLDQLLPILTTWLSASLHD
jgi:esterase FrsA